MNKAEKKHAKTGPKPERLKLKGNWETRVKDALKKKRPPEGWPKQESTES